MEPIHVFEDDVGHQAVAINPIKRHTKLKTLTNINFVNTI